MSWDFLWLVREAYQSDNNWGRLYIRSKDLKKWETFSYSYELDWIEDASGKSKSNKSRIRIGIYEMKTRSDGNKGWRLELEGTGHRTHIQVHRAHKSMFIQGCILPVHFRDFDKAGLKKGDNKIQAESVKLMEQMKARYLECKKVAKGKPSITISAILPEPMLPPGVAYA